MEKTTAELDGTLVLNYVDDEVEMLEIEVIDQPVLDDNFDENQNTKHDSKAPIEESSQNDKDLVVLIENSDLSPKKVIPDVEDKSIKPEAKKLNLEMEVDIHPSEQSDTISKGSKAKRGRSIEKKNNSDSPRSKKLKTLAAASKNTDSKQDEVSRTLESRTLKSPIIQNNFPVSTSQTGIKKYLVQSDDLKKVTSKSNDFQEKSGSKKKAVEVPKEKKLDVQMCSQEIPSQSPKRKVGRPKHVSLEHNLSNNLPAISIGMNSEANEKDEAIKLSTHKRGRPKAAEPVKETKKGRPKKSVSMVKEVVNSQEKNMDINVKLLKKSSTSKRNNERSTRNKNVEAVVVGSKSNDEKHNLNTQIQEVKTFISDKDIKKNKKCDSLDGNKSKALSPSKISEKEVKIGNVEILEKKQGRTKGPSHAKGSGTAKSKSSKNIKIVDTIDLESTTSDNNKGSKRSKKTLNKLGKSTSENGKKLAKVLVGELTASAPPNNILSEDKQKVSAAHKKSRTMCTVGTQTIEICEPEVKDSGKKIIINSVEVLNVDNESRKKSKAKAGNSKDVRQADPSEAKITETISVDDEERIKFEEDNGNREAVPIIQVDNSAAEPGVKHEPVEQIHTEFKYESQSETEEMLKKRRGKLGGPMRGKRRGVNNSDETKGQTTIDNFFRIVDLDGKVLVNNKVHAFKCDQCLYVGNSKANLERHTLIHQNPEEIVWFTCTECPYKSKYKHQLKSHFLIHKKPDELEFFQCPHCEVKCTRKHNLTNHIRSMHSDRDNSLKCAECDYSTFSKDRLVAHLRKHSKEVHACNLCKFVTKRQDYLDSHFKLKHTDEVQRPFPCDTCSYKGKTKRELDKHFDRMHNKDKLHVFQCNLCAFNSIYKKNLEFHLLHMHQNSEGFQKFICGHCNKTFVYKNGLKVHIIRCHIKLLDDDWHKCLECKYKSKDVTTLKRHIKRNHGAPRLHCKQCSFATNRQMSMDAHMKTHEYDNEDILKCPECPYRILQMTSFLYHMKVIHGKPITSKEADKYYMQDE